MSDQNNLEEEQFNVPVRVMPAQTAELPAVSAPPPPSSAVLEEGPISAPEPLEVEPLKQEVKFSLKRAAGITCIVVGIIVGAALVVNSLSSTKNLQANLADANSRVKQQSVSFSGVTEQLGTPSTQQGTLTINGKLAVSNSVNLTPTAQPSKAQVGQLYYDQSANRLAYYDGTSYLYLQGGGNTTNNITNNVINNIAGAVTNVTNVTNNTTVNGGGLSGTGTPGTLAMFATTSTLADSLLSQSGTTINTSADALQGNGSGLTVLTANATGVTGNLILQSGNSSTDASGTVIIDSGSGIVNGTVIEDYTFETGLDGFDNTPYGGTNAQSSAQAHSGSDSLALTMSTTSWSDAAVHAITVVPGHEYRVSAWVRAAAATSPVQLDVYLRSLNQSVTPVNITDSASAWTQMSSTFLNPAGNTLIDPSFVYQKNGAPGEVHYIDDVTITDLNTFTGLSVDVGTTNAQEINIGNSNQAGDTTITGGTTGIKIQDTSGSASINTDGVNVDSGAGNVSVITGDSAANTGSISLISGTSSSAQAGDVTLDTGSGLVSGNIVYNFGFEDGLDGFGIYTGSGVTCTQSSTFAHTGGFSLKLTGSSSPSCVNYGSPVTGGHTYLLSAWVRTGSGAGSAFLAANWSNFGGSIGSSSSNCSATAISSTAWTQLLCESKDPVGLPYVNLLAFNNSGNSPIYIDDFTVTDMSSLTGSEINIGANSAQGITIGNANEIGATTINGGQAGVIVNSGSGGLSVNASSFGISGTAASSVGTSSGSLTLSSGGGSAGNGVVVQPQNDATDAFKVQNAGGDTTLLNVDTVNNQVSLGTGAGSSTGNTTIGVGSGGGSGTNIITAQKETTTGGGVVASMSVYLGAWGIQAPPNNDFQLAIYADNGSGAPGTYIASSPVTAMSAVGWYTVPISATLSPSTTYWFAYTQNGNIGSDDGYSYTPSVSSAVNVVSTAIWQSGPDNGLPGTFPAVSASYNAYGSIYASYASSGPALIINQNGKLTQSGAALFQDPTDSTNTFQIQNSLGSGIFTVDAANNAIVLGNDGTPTALTVRGGAASGTDAPGANLIIQGSNGTGNANGGDILLQTAPATTGGIIFDSANTGIVGHGGSSVGTINMTIANKPDRLLIVVASNQVNSMSYDGQALTLLSSEFTGSDGSVQSFIWYLVNPPSGSNTVSVDQLPGTNFNASLGATVYYNASQTNPFGTPVVQQGKPSSNTTSALSVNTSSTSQVVFDTISGQTCTTANGQTVRLDSSHAFASEACAGDMGANGGVTTIGWHIAANDAYTEIAVPVNPELAGSTPYTIPSGSNPDIMNTTLDITATGDVGINTSNPQATLDVNGNTYIHADSAAAVQIQNTVGSTLFMADTHNMIVTIAKLAVTGDISVGGHFITGGSAPNSAAGAAANCSSSGTIAVAGDDTSGTITVTTGTGTCAGGSLATLTFANAYTGTPRIVLTPGGSSAQTLGAYFNSSTLSGSSFSIGTNSTPAPTTTYVWDYWIGQ